MLVVVAGLNGTQGFAQTAAPLRAEVRQQIADLLRMKATFSKAEQKLSSNLVMLNRQARGVPLGSAAGILDTRKVSKGMAHVDIRAKVSDPLLANLAANAGRVEYASAQYGFIRARLPVAALHSIAAHPAVNSIREADEALLNVGSLTSQGYVGHDARSVVEEGIDGTGVKVGVLSDSATNVAARVADGNLGTNAIVLPGQAGTGNDEGTAMMEIVQDIAPGAQVCFATANGGEAVMASNITALAAAGCAVIVDDISYYAEAAFQDGPIAQAVNTFVASGGVYFSSAANSGNLTSGTSGTWEGDFLDGGPVTGVITNIETGRVHNFGTVGSPVLYDTLTAAGGNYISLKWSDPLGASANDYDLFILDSAGTTVKAASTSSQTGTQDPVEIVGYGSPLAGDRVVVVLYDGLARALRVDTHRGRLALATRGSTYGHNAGQNTTTVAATFWGSARAGTSLFNGANNPIETFSSDGPRRIFYNPNGTAITPGNVLFATGGGANLPKPEITAADGVFCKSLGFLPFYGTSAAAPHAAGVAALVKAANPALTGPQIRQILMNTALDNMAAGFDYDGGFGVISAAAAVRAAKPQ